MPTLSLLQQSLVIGPDFKIFLDFANQLTTQVLTVSGAILTISIAFFKDFSKSKAWIILGLSWVLIFLSILFGTAHLMALTGIVETALVTNRPPRMEGNAKFFAGLQLSLFVAGTLSLVIYGIMALWSQRGGSARRKK